jgi:hypothetical protein
MRGRAGGARVSPSSGGGRGRRPPRRGRAPTLAALNANVARLARQLERANIGALAEVVQSPWRLFWTHFAAGVARGVGMLLGAGVMGAVIVGLISWFVYHLLQVAEMIPILNELMDAVKAVVMEFLEKHRQGGG